jgi:hypothetical protein
MTDDALKLFVLELEEKVWQAVIEKNGGTLGELFADNYIEITLEGKRVEKAEIVELSPQVDEINGYTMDSERVVPLGSNSALLSYHLTLDGRTQGKTITPRDRWATSIWSQIDGKWQCCFYQQSVYLLQED